MVVCRTDFVPKKQVMLVDSEARQWTTDDIYSFILSVDEPYCAEAAITGDSQMLHPLTTMTARRYCIRCYEQVNASVPGDRQ